MLRVGAGPPGAYVGDPPTARPQLLLGAIQRASVIGSLSPLATKDFSSSGDVQPELNPVCLHAIGIEHDGHFPWAAWPGSPARSMTVIARSLRELGHFAVTGVVMVVRMNRLLQV